MNKKEISEIKKQFTPNNCAITRICGCYVDGEKNKKTKLYKKYRKTGKRLLKFKLTIRKQQRYNQNNPRDSALFKTVDTTERLQKYNTDK